MLSSSGKASEEGEAAGRSADCLLRSHPDAVQEDGAGKALPADCPHQSGSSRGDPATPYLPPQRGNGCITGRYDIIDGRRVPTSGSGGIATRLEIMDEGVHKHCFHVRGQNKLPCLWMRLTRLYTCLVLLPHSAGFGDCRPLEILIPASLGERFISESLEFIIPRRRNSLYAADALPKFYSYAGSIVQV